MNGPLLFGINQRSGDALKNGRSGGIRTRDPLLPKQMRYQAALRSDCIYSNLQTLAFHDLRRKNLSPPCDSLATDAGKASVLQLPRVMGMPMSPGSANCLASSSLASELRCTSSGPSAKRKVRWWAYA